MVKRLLDLIQITISNWFQRRLEVAVSRSIRHGAQDRAARRELDSNKDLYSLQPRDHCHLEEPRRRLDAEGAKTLAFFAAMEEIEQAECEHDWLCYFLEGREAQRRARAAFRENTGLAAATVRYRAK